MSPPKGAADYLQVCFPRVSGDEPRGALGSRSAARFSPRERG